MPKWNQATDDIDTADFARGALDYERSLLPRDAAFPRVGQIGSRSATERLIFLLPLIHGELDWRRRLGMANIIDELVSD